MHSEVGKLRKVIVHRPGLEMRRLTPTNCQSLLFDDVIWARKARQEHDAFVDLMRNEFGVDVMRVHELLEDVVDDPEGRAYILDRKLVPNEVGVGGAGELRAWMDEMDSTKLVAHLIVGVTVAELPEDFRRAVEKAYAGTEFALPPLPNQLFTRDSSCWIYDGVTVNPMFWPARRKETLHLTAIYKYHPKFKGGDFTIWWGDPDKAVRKRRFPLVPLGCSSENHLIGGRDSPCLRTRRINPFRRPWSSLGTCGWRTPTREKADPSCSSTESPRRVICGGT